MLIRFSRHESPFAGPPAAQPARGQDKEHILVSVRMLLTSTSKRISTKKYTHMVSHGVSVSERYKVGFLDNVERARPVHSELVRSIMDRIRR